MAPPTPQHAARQVSIPEKVGGSTVALILGLGIIVLVLVLGLVYLAGPDGRGEALDWLAGLVPIVGAIITGGVALQVRNASREQRATNETVRRVQEQTNGGLDKRIRQAVADALADDGS